MRLLTVTLLAAELLTAPISFSQQPAISPSYGKVPLGFEANVGQAASHVNFLSRNKGYTALLSGGNLTLSLRAKAVQAVGGSTATQPPEQPRVVQVQLVGASKTSIAVGEAPQPGKVNYFFGNNPAHWRTNVPTYGAVRYRNVYPGTDLLYYGNKGRMEFDFELQSGADPSRIQFEIRGADSVKLDSTGALVLRLGAQSLQVQPPSVYQQMNGRRVAIDGSYVLTDPSHVAFKLAQYDAGKPLVIDPVLVYSTYLGGSGDDEVTGIAVDGTGSVYVAGYTNSANFPLATQGSLPAGSDHVFVSKLDPTGSTLIYTDYIGGNAQDYGFALAINSSNEVYVTGSTASSNFPVVNAYQASYPGSFNGFLTRISADGSSLLYSTYFGGNGSDMPASLALDSGANILIGGNTSSTNFPVINAYQPIPAPNQGGFYGNYGFLSKFTADGSSLVYSTYFGGSTNVPYNCGGTPCWPQPYSAITGVSLDAAGNAYVAGNTNTYDFPTTTGAYLTTNSTQLNSSVAFTGKFNSLGSLQYSTYFYDPSGFTNITAIAVDAAGSAYVSGTGLSDGTFPLTATGICDPAVYSAACGYAFVSKFNPAGSSLAYSTFLGPNNYATPAALILGQNNNAYVLATTASNNFALVNGIETYTGGNDLLVAEIDSVAGSELNATYIGGTTDERAIAMALDPGGNLYVTGTTNSTDFPVTEAAFQQQPGGSIDAFILKVGSASLPAVVMNPYSLQFPTVQIGSSSPVQQVQLRNMGSAPLTINSISMPGNFTETDSCGASVPAAGTCSLSVTFTPTAAGALSGSIALHDNAAGSPHLIALTGTGFGPVVSLNPSTLTFAATTVGVTSSAQSLMLTNQGNFSMSINSILSSGDYAQTNNCPGALAPQSSCTINVTFTPTVEGSRIGTVTINDSAAGSPHTISLTGIGSGPVVSVNSSTLTFPGTPVGVTSTAQVITVTNQGNASSTISGVQISGDYAQTNNCSATLTAQSSCTINVTFTPTITGNRAGTLTIVDNAPGSPHSVALSGSGADFSLTTGQPSATVKAGATATYTMSVASTGGAFTNAVKLACSGAPSLTTCNLSSNSVTPGSSTVNVTVTIATTGTSAQLTPLTPGANRIAFAFWVPFSGVGLVGLVLAKSKRIGNNALPLALVLATLALIFMTGCAGGTGIAPGGKGTTPGTYSITITGTSGNLKHSLPLTLTVQ